MRPLYIELSRLNLEYPYSRSEYERKCFLDIEFVSQEKTKRMPYYSGYLPDGPERPIQEMLDAFWADAKAAHPEIGDAFEVRWFGVDAKTTRGIFGYITDGVKTATYTLPWILEQEGVPISKLGTYVVLIDFDGTPMLLLRLGPAKTWRFADIDERVTHTDGLSVRDPGVWKPLHRKFWNSELERYDLEVTDDMPVLVEEIELVYARAF